MHGNWKRFQRRNRRTEPIGPRPTTPFGNAERNGTGCCCYTLDFVVVVAAAALANAQHEIDSKACYPGVTAVEVAWTSKPGPSKVTSAAQQHDVHCNCVGQCWRCDRIVGTFRASEERNCNDKVADSCSVVVVAVAVAGTCVGHNTAAA